MSGDAGSQANAHHCWQVLCGIIVDPGKRACWPGLFARGQELVCFSSNVHRIVDGCLAGVRFIPWSWQRRARLAVRSDQTYLASSVYNLDPSPLALVSSAGSSKHTDAAVVVDHQKWALTERLASQPRSRE